MSFNDASVVASLHQQASQTVEFDAVATTTVPLSNE
jgi:hypothetical protein